MGRRPGTYEIDVHTWKPRGSIRDRMSDYFLGGARHLADHVNYSAHPNPADRGPFLNKYGFVTETSGKIRIRVNVVMQRKETTIEEIFQSVKVGTSLTLKEALGKPNENNRKNLTRLYAGLSSSSNNPLGMSTPG